jgi:hypothetical protein
LLATPAYNYLSNTFLNRPIDYYLVYAGFALFFLVNLAAIVVPLRLGIRTLERRDF